jgi:hypothetical protein
MPIIPGSHDLLVTTDDWHELVTVLTMMCLASLLASLIVFPLIRSTQLKQVALGGALLAVVAGALFAVEFVLFTDACNIITGNSEHPLLLRLIGEVPFDAFYGVAFVLRSGWVTVPLGIGLAFLLHAAAFPKRQDPQPEIAQ